jgi:hypothetical protein
MRELIDIFLNQKNTFHFCKGIVFDIIEDLKPTPPPEPDFSKLEIRKEIFKKLNKDKNFQFDLFVDKYGLNLFRNCTRILNILQKKEDFNLKMVEEIEELESERLKKKVTIDQSKKEIQNQKSESIIIKKKSENTSSKREVSNNISQNKFVSNLTSNMVTFKEVGNRVNVEKLEINSNKLITYDQIISQVFNQDLPSDYQNQFWDMDFETLEQLKSDILEHLEHYDEDEVFEITESINSRIQILKDSCLVKKPESSVLFDYLQKELFHYFDQVIEEVDKKREELDLPAFHGENDQPLNDPQLENKDKKKKKYKNEAEMTKVWNENKEKVIFELEYKFKEPLMSIFENQEKFRFKNEVEELIRKNNNLIEDKEVIMNFNKKLGVDDIIFNNKNVLFKIDMHIKPDIVLKPVSEEDENPM